MVLEEVGTSMSRSLRGRRARNTDSALRISRQIARNDGMGSCRSPNLQLDGVTLHFVIERGTLDAEKFGRLFLVTAALCERLTNGAISGGMSSFRFRSGGTSI